MTTTTRSTTTCTDCGNKVTASNSAAKHGGSDFKNMCITCYEYAGWENTHSDEGHDDENADPRCPLCGPVFAKLGEALSAGDRPEHVSTGRKNMSHARCAHAATPKERAACRKRNS